MRGFEEHDGGLVRTSARQRASQIFRSFDLTGGKPRNTNAPSSRPATDMAAATALAPGTGSTRIPCCAGQPDQCRPPGPKCRAYQHRKPAQRTARAVSSSISPAARVRSLWACRLMSRVGIPKWRRRFPVRRVSSAATSATSRSTRRARRVMSSRWPIGVATTNSVPAIFYCNLGRWPHDGGCGHDRPHARRGTAQPLRRRLPRLSVRGRVRPTPPSMASICTMTCSRTSGRGPSTRTWGRWRGSPADSTPFQSTCSPSTSRWTTPSRPATSGPDVRARGDPHLGAEPSHVRRSPRLQPGHAGHLHLRP